MANSISGALGGVGAGATVNYTGTASGSVTADGSGNYTIPGLSNGDYTINPTKNGAYFTPATSATNPLLAINTVANKANGAVIKGADVTGINFTTTLVNIFYYKGAGTSGSAVTTLSTAATASIAGNPIIVLVRAANISSISDTAGNTFTQVGTTASGVLSTWYLVSSSLGNAANVVTVNFSSQSFAALEVYEIQSQPLGTLALLETDLATLASGTAINSGTLSIFAANNFVVCNENANSNAAVSTVRGLLTNISETSNNFARNTGYGFVVNGTSSGTAGFNLTGTGSTITLVTAVFGWINNSLRGNCGVGGATVSYSGPRSGSVTADINGNYVIPFTSAADVATWTITPTQTGVTFSPASNTVAVGNLNVDVTGPTFTGSLTSPMSGITVTWSKTDTTITASWTTPGACDSKAFAGAKAAIDNVLPSAETTHYAVITGLTPSTTYACYAQSLGSNSAVTNVTTNPRQPRFTVSGIAYGSVTDGLTNGGDTFFNFQSNDGITYTSQDDGIGLSNIGTFGNCVVCKLTNAAAATGTTINRMTGLGAGNTYDGQDSPSNVTSTKKYGGGIFGIAGNLFACILRQAISTDNYALYRGTVLKSTDKGLTWSGVQSPNTATAAAYEPNPIFSYIYGDPTYGWASPVNYAPDDGTLGYNTAGNQIDGGNAFVYQSIGPVPIATGSSTMGEYAYMMRTPRRAFNQLLIGPGYSTYWAGPVSPTDADFVNDANWISAATPSGLTKLFTVGTADGLWWHKMVFIPRLNSYVMFSFTSKEALVAPTPGGPWTTLTPTNLPNQSVYQGYSILHGDAAANTAAQNLSLRVMFNSVFTGNNGAATALATFTTSAYPISGNAGVGGATITYSGTASGSVVADALGNYIIPGLANGSYTLTPSLAGYTFSPVNSAQTVANADITGVNFTATPVPAASGSGTHFAFDFRF